MGRANGSICSEPINTAFALNVGIPGSDWIGGIVLKIVRFHINISAPRQTPDGSASARLDPLWSLSSGCVCACMNGYSHWCTMFYQF